MNSVKVRLILLSMFKHIDLIGLYFFVSVGSLGWFDRTCSLQQEQRTENRFRSRCYQPEGGRPGKGLALVTTAARRKIKKKCFRCFEELNFLLAVRTGDTNLTLNCFYRLEHGILPVVSI